MALFTVTCVHCNSQLRNLYKLVTAGVHENVIGLIMTLTCTYTTIQIRKLQSLKKTAVRLLLTWILSNVMDLDQPVIRYIFSTAVYVLAVYMHETDKLLHMFQIQSSPVGEPRGLMNIGNVTPTSPTTPSGKAGSQGM